MSLGLLGAGRYVVMELRALGYAPMFRFLLKWSPVWTQLAVILITGYTAYWIVKYTKETQLLRGLAVQQRVDGARPLIVFHIAGPYQFSVTNIGKGPALDIELRLTQIHESGGLTNLRNLDTRDEDRQLLNLGENEKSLLTGSDVIRQYAVADEPDWRWGQRGVFAVLATYTDLERRPYYTLSLIAVFGMPDVPVMRIADRQLVLKSTKTASYASGEIETLNVIDWLK